MKAGRLLDLQSPPISPAHAHRRYILNTISSCAAAQIRPVRARFCGHTRRSGQLDRTRVADCIDLCNDSSTRWPDSLATQLAIPALASQSLQSFAARGSACYTRQTRYSFDTANWYLSFGVQTSKQSYSNDSSSPAPISHGRPR